MIVSLGNGLFIYERLYSQLKQLLWPGKFLLCPLKYFTMKKLTQKTTIAVMLLVGITLSGSVAAQTDIDAIMMEKNAFCVGPMYSYSSWKN